MGSWNGLWIGEWIEEGKLLRFEKVAEFWTVSMGLLGDEIGLRICGPKLDLMEEDEFVNVVMGQGGRMFGREWRL